MLSFEVILNALVKSLQERFPSIPINPYTRLDKLVDPFNHILAVMINDEPWVKSCGVSLTSKDLDQCSLVRDIAVILERPPPMVRNSFAVRHLAHRYNPVSWPQPKPPPLPPNKIGTYEVCYGTNRRPEDPRGIACGFSGDRDSKVHVGFCTVNIPASHRIGSVGSPLWKRILTGDDDRLKLKAIEELSSDGFWARVSTRLNKLGFEDREAVIFVHGYNVSFEAAAIRAAQVGADLAIRGTTAFFSWPSKGSTESYIHDEASIEASEPAITQFLVDFAEKSGASKLHIIAHSMGNRGVLRAVNRIAATASERTGRPFDQIILAAPDVDADVFRDLCKAYAQVSRRTTLYVSKKDLAVEAARWLHGFPRAGLLPPVMVVPGIDTVNVTHADLTKLGHGYVAESRLVLNDMHALLRLGASPDDRAGLLRIGSHNGPYWEIGR